MTIGFRDLLQQCFSNFLLQSTVVNVFSTVMYIKWKQMCHRTIFYLYSMYKNTYSMYLFCILFYLYSNIFYTIVLYYFYTIVIVNILLFYSILFFLFNTGCSLIMLLTQHSDNQHTV